MVGEEEKSFVFQTSSAEVPPEIIVTFRWARHTCLIRKPVVRVQDIVAKVLVASTMEILRTRACCQDDLPTRRAAKFGRKRRRFNTKFLQSLYRNQTTCASDGAESLRSTGPGFSYVGGGRDDSKICRHAVDSEIVRISSLPRDTKLPRRKTVAGSNDNSRS